MPFKPGQSGNPGGFPKGHKKPSYILRRFGCMTVHELMALEHLTVLEEICRRQIMDATAVVDDGVRLRFVETVADRVEGKPAQSVEVRSETIISPIQRDGTSVERAMAAAQLLRSAGIDVPVALQTLIETPDDD